MTVWDAVSMTVAERQAAEAAIQEHVNDRLGVAFRVTGNEAKPLAPDAEAPKMREFATGATRNTDTDKLDYEGFLSPGVLKRYAEYMHTNRLQADGKLRSSDNWQKGIPKDEYMKSLLRHVMTVWEIHRRKDPLRQPEKNEALCAVMFNVMGYLHESLTRG